MRRRESPSGRTARAVVIAAAAAGLLCAPVGLAAQDLGSGELSDRPVWLRAWSPMHSTAGLARGLPDGLAVLPEPLLWPGARAGLFWTAGNPGALALELDDHFSLYAVGLSEVDGEYRRPLDPAAVRGPSAHASAWRPFGTTGAAIGRVRVASVEMTRALSDYDLPYGGSPYVVMDTAASDLGRAVVELEGAAAWRTGRLGFGLAMGYRAHHTRTREAPVPRTLSAADPAVSLGLAWALSPRLRVGVHGRWRQHAERVTMYNVAATTRVYRLQGFFEPPPQDLASGYYQRRLEREGYAGGVSAGGTALGADWAAFVEAGTQDERQHAAGFANPDADTWDTDALTLGASLIRPFSPRNASLSLTLRYTDLSGTAHRGDLQDTTTYVADEAVFHGEGELALDASETVRLVGRMVVRQEDRTRDDYLAHVRSQVRSWSTALGMAAVVRASARLSVAAAAGETWYGPGGTIPDPGAMGTAYGLYVAPEMALAASDAASLGASLTATWRLREAVALWTALRYSSLSDVEQSVSLASLPEGDRTAYALVVGLRVGG